MIEVLTWDGTGWSHTEHFKHMGSLVSGGPWIHLTHDALHRRVGDAWVPEALPASEYAQRFFGLADDLVAAVLQDVLDYKSVDPVVVYERVDGAWDGGVLLPLPGFVDASVPLGPVVGDGSTIVARAQVEDVDRGGPAVLYRGVLLVWRRYLDGWRLTATIEAPRVGDGFGWSMALAARDLVVLSASEGHATDPADGVPAPISRYLLPAIDADGDGEDETIDPDDLDPAVTSRGARDTDTDTDAETRAPADSDAADDTLPPSEPISGGCAHTRAIPGFGVLGLLVAMAGTRRRGGVRR